MASISPVQLVRAAASNPAAIFLDVRTDDEIKETCLKSRPFLHVSCTPDDCSTLIAKADELLPDKNAPVIIFCRSGRRAGKAKEALDLKGYTNVLNAGALADLTNALGSD